MDVPTYNLGRGPEDRAVVAILGDRLPAREAMMRRRDHPPLLAQDPHRTGLWEAVIWLAVPVTLVLIFLALWLAGRADGHELMTKGGTVTDYSGWKTPNGGDCCANTHCRPVAQQLNAAGEIELEIAPGVWVVPPASRELPPLNESAHACLTHDGRTFLCWRQVLMGT